MREKSGEGSAGITVIVFFVFYVYLASVKMLFGQNYLCAIQGLDTLFLLSKLITCNSV